jgi:hypothetical protein
MEQAYCYQIFDLVVRSDVHLPNLRAYANTAPDVNIVVADHLPGRAGSTTFATPAAAFEVSKGREIALVPTPEASGAEVRAYLTGQALAALMRQRGKLALHASALIIGSKVSLFAGPKGAGKSTIAAAWLARGQRVISDDLAIVAPQHATIPPGLPYIKLWPESLALLTDKSEELALVHPDFDKRIFSNPRASRGGGQVSSAFFIHRGAATPRVEPISAPETVALLSAHSFAPTLIRDHRGLQHNFAGCAQLARRIRAFRLHVPNSLGQIDAVLDAVTCIERQATSC